MEGVRYIPNSLFSFGIRCQSMNIIESLKDYDRLYYETGESPVSDVEYDRLKDLAKSKYPKDSYFNTVGAITRDKVKLPYVLGSLNKKKPDTICKWLDDNSGPYVVSEKIDGVSVFVEKKKWYLQMDNKCRFLKENNQCGMYDKRPLICKEHCPSTCENAMGHFDHEYTFKSLKEIDTYLAKRFSRKR